MNLMLNDPETKQPSTTRSVFWYGCLLCFVKFAASGLDLHAFKIPVFNGSDFAVAIVALGGIYGLDKHIGNIKKDN